MKNGTDTILYIHFPYKSQYIHPFFSPFWAHIFFIVHLLWKNQPYNDLLSVYRMLCHHKHHGLVESRLFSLVFLEWCWLYFFFLILHRYIFLLLLSIVRNHVSLEFRLLKGRSRAELFVPFRGTDCVQLYTWGIVRFLCSELIFEIYRVYDRMEAKGKPEVTLES